MSATNQGSNVAGGDLHQTSTPRLVRMDQKTNCAKLVGTLMPKLWNEATYTMVDVGDDVKDFIGAVLSFKYTCRCPLFPAELLDLHQPGNGVDITVLTPFRVGQMRHLTNWY